jgi:hypothetical protein
MSRRERSRRSRPASAARTTATAIRCGPPPTGCTSSAPENDLARVPLTGGAVEVLSPDQARHGVNGVVSDACNVYWLAGPSFTDSTAPAVYVRAR